MTGVKIAGFRTPGSAVYRDLLDALTRAIADRDESAAHWDAEYAWERPGRLIGVSHVELERRVATLADAIRGLAVAGETACLGGRVL